MKNIENFIAELKKKKNIGRLIIIKILKQYYQQSEILIQMNKMFDKKSLIDIDEKILIKIANELNMNLKYYFDSINIKAKTSTFKISELKELKYERL